MRILLVDDNQELRQFLAVSLAEVAIDVVEAPDAASAIKCVEAEKFDGFVVDSVMPDGDGLSLVGQLRALKNGRGVPVLLMSSLATSLARRMAQNAGCDEFLVKPFGPMQFVEQVKELEKVRR